MKHTPLIRIWESDWYGLSFLGIPKTGSSTVRKALGLKDWVEVSQGARYPIFTVIRDPYERLISSYLETTRRRTHQGNLNYFCFRLLDGGFFDEHTLPQSYYLTIKPAYFLTLDRLWTGLEYLAGTRLPRYRENQSERGMDIEADVDLVVKTITKLYAEDVNLYRKISEAQKVSKASVVVVEQ